MTRIERMLQGQQGKVRFYARRAVSLCAEHAPPVQINANIKLVEYHDFLAQKYESLIARAARSVAKAPAR